MDIQALRLTLTEGDLNGLILRNARDTGPVENLRVRLTPQGLVVQGEYPALFMKVGFETTWELSASGSEVQARLTTVNVAGLPAGVLRGMLLKAVRDATAAVPAVQVGDEVVRVNVEQILLARGLPAHLHLKRVACAAGTLSVEAGT